MSVRLWRGRLPCSLAFLAALASAGCARGPDTDYGSSRGASLNGTSAFASMLRAEGHQLRTAIRLNSEVAGWAEGIVRFAQHPGPPARDEAKWYADWLAADYRRWLIYVVRDFDAAPEYWSEVQKGLAQNEAARRAEAEELRNEAAGWVERLPPKPAELAGRASWFGVDAAFSPPQTCAQLGGPWAKGVDAAGAALTLHEPLLPANGRVLLEGDSKPIVLERLRAAGGRELAIANGSFLLNEPLAHEARRPLARRVLEWAGRRPCRVAVVEGSYTLAGPEAPPTLFDLLKRVPPLRWIAIQMGLAGLLAALARAPRLGRPRQERASGSDRPAAHAEALGSLLSRTGDLETARALLEAYRQWRHPHAALGSGRISGRALPRSISQGAPVPGEVPTPELQEVPVSAARKTRDSSQGSILPARQSSDG